MEASSVHEEQKYDRFLQKKIISGGARAESTIFQKKFAVRRQSYLLLGYLSQLVAIDMEDVWDPKVQKYDLFLQKILDLDLEMTFQGQNVKVVVETRFFFK